MNAVFKIILFALCLNVATTLMVMLIPELGQNPQYNPYKTDDRMAIFNTEMNSTISPVPDQSNTFFRLIDSLNIGLLGKFLLMIPSLFYGFINFLWAVFPVIPDEIIYTLYGILTSCYIIGAFWLWTGKNLT